MRCLSFFLPLVLALAASSEAQLFPPVPKTGTVYDGAHLLTPSAVQTIDSVSRRFKNREGAPIVVATLPSLQSVGAKAIGVERYAAMLFDQWRIGRKERNVGILLLVAKDDHKMRVELGKDLGHDYDVAVHWIDVGTILPAFKKGDYEGGIVRGVQALSHLPDAAPTNASPAQPPSEALASSPPSGDSFDQDIPMNSPSPSFFDGGFLLFLVPIVFLFIIVAAVSKRRTGYGPSRRFGSGFGPNSNTTYVNNTYVNNGDGGFTAGLIAGEMMSQPSYGSTPSFDSGPSIDTSPSFDSGSSVDSGSSSSDSGSFDSGSSGGGGDSGSW